MADHYIGLDLGGTNINYAVVEVDPDGVRPTVLVSDKVRTQAHHGPARVRDRLIDVGRKLTAENGAIAGVGIGVPGLFDAETGVVEFFPNLPGPWEGFSLRDPVGEGIGSSATMINDARAFTLAEGMIGSGADAKVMLGITLGTGIGGGIMIGGKLHLGAFGTAGEFGHQTVDPTVRSVAVVIMVVLRPWQRAPRLPRQRVLRTPWLLLPRRGRAIRGRSRQ